MAMLVLGLAGPHLAQAQAPHALVLEVSGIINPVKRDFIARAIQQAQLDQATVVVIELDTPGGLLSSTREIVEELLAATVPVAVYVSPRGARAGSAGTFITAAAHFAVMAPGTNIGAATPVSSTGEDIPETLASKVENDVAALIRSIAEERGRNKDKLEETVRKAASFTAKEAVELNVVDFIADDLDALLARIHGEEVETPSGPRTLDTRDVEQRRFKKNLLENFLEIISDPNVSFILLTLGGLGLVIELFNPGLIAPGVVGVIFLLLAFLASGNLPVNWAGVVFVFVAIALAVLETQVTGFGILGVGAIVSFLVGGLILFTQFGDVSPTLPEVSVSLWLIGGMAVTFAFALLYVVRTIHQSRRSGSLVTVPSLIGAVGTVSSDLAPRGLVRFGSGTWTAVSEDGNVISEGESVRVIQVEGLILTVSRQEDTNT
ncbi:MAG: nodulation protein NfeD [Chloroflexi bacterium]|nr:nodulation protein NfeD [Chloroflexota bacterium]